VPPRIARGKDRPLMADTADPVVYLDHNATTPVLPEVLDAMLPYLREQFGNPSSSHGPGRRAHAAVERARVQVAALLGCDEDEVVFTSGGTESNNLALRGVVEARGRRRHVVTTAIEHPAIAAPCAWLERHGVRVSRIGVDPDGVASIDEARSVIDDETALVSIMHANNETGVLQPVEEIARLGREHGATLHTDAAQSAGKVPLEVRRLDVDLLSLAGHKLYAPKGIGALYVRRGTLILPFVLGAGHERGLRPGTENVASIVGLGVACEIARRDMAEVEKRIAGLRDELWAKLVAAIPGIALNGHPHLRLPNTLNVRFPGASGTAILAGVPRIAASTGSACHAGGESASAVILAMRVAPRDAIGSVRLSLGRGTTSTDVATAADALARAWREVGKG
jgi:cysteine desulfurase